ncbi:hypothetical protein Ga0609869_003439 [Rhodovulum iodosum]|uniref:Secreted protein n=1 Tax=Rhodovulum iodosum TaxID=68291 RepID=A0ABV3XXI9_9RHOB|nr:hypothetical protein [Rhodovulum robiginosum]RSK38085.1 hypothetical protein EJA01_02935 [Rhodovulum robiginosum]
MTAFRPFLAFGLALALALSSLSLAVARGQGAATGEIVICTGFGLQTIALDAEGNPTGPAHVCPDGVAALVSLAVLPPALPARPAAARLRRSRHRRCTRRGRTPVAARARAPPA